jgi:hypothetical protein
VIEREKEKRGETGAASKQRQEKKAKTDRRTKREPLTVSTSVLLLRVFTDK